MFNVLAARAPRRFFLFTAAVALLHNVAGCGGGDGDESSECSGNQNVYSDVVYLSNGGAGVGEPFAITPTTPGVPSACLGQRSFTTYAPRMAPGLTLDPGTGTISGTPTHAGFYETGVNLYMRGFSGNSSGYFSVEVHQRADYTYTSWRRRSLPASADATRIHATDSGLMALQLKGTGTPEVKVSLDEGQTWATLPGANAPFLNSSSVSTHHTGSHLLAWDSKVLYRHDGSAWEVVSQAAPVGGGRQMVQAGSRLYSVGRDASVPSRSVFASDDGGVTWQKLTENYAPETNSGLCAVAFGDGLAVIGKRLERLTNIVPTVWKSSDGVQWQEVVIPPNSPLLAFSPNDMVCHTWRGRAYVMGWGGGVFSSANLSDWQFEPALSRYQAPWPDKPTMTAGKDSLFVLASLQQSGVGIFQTQP